MNAKTVKKLRKLARRIYSNQTQSERVTRGYIVVGQKNKEFPTGKTNIDGTPEKIKFQVLVLGNNPHSYRGIYRKLKKDSR